MTAAMLEYNREMALPQGPLFGRSMVPLLLPLRDSSALPLHRQLYDGLRDAILTGRLTAGQRLPSTRVLAESLGISRNTVMTAFDQLLAEGYMEGRVGSGTYISEKLPDDLLNARPVDRTPALRRTAARLSKLGHVLATTAAIPRRPHTPPRPFRPGPPSTMEFPWKIWVNLFSRRWRNPSRELVAYGQPQGYRPLREAIAAYVRSSRAVRCEAEQVLIIAGSQQGLDLVARLLINPGDRVWIEEPGYLGARGAFLGAGARLVPVPVDQDGFDVDYAIARRPARVVYLTPSHQFPLGATLTLARRLQLLEWAAQSQAWIVEDDYNSEFRHAGRPIASLQGLDSSGRVIYMGSFSKVLFPALRLGYLILPPNLIDAFISARRLADYHSPTVEQAVLADFMEAGHFGRHIRRMRGIYAERQDALIDAFRRHLPRLIDVKPAQAGMHVVGWLPRNVSDVEMSQRAIDSGIEAPSLSAFSLRPRRAGGLILGYAAFTPREIREGAKRLAIALA
jgi:GntR family transcriptional regulator/MocR family aminotransferase